MLFPQVPSGDIECVPSDLDVDTWEDLRSSLDLDKVSKCLTLPIATAAKNMDVPLYKIKKAKKQLGIERWPSKTSASLDQLITNTNKHVVRLVRLVRLSTFTSLSHHQSLNLLCFAGSCDAL